MIVLTWIVPPVFGLSFLIFIKMFTLAQVGAILAKPPLTGYCILSLAASVWYFGRFVQPIVDYLNKPISTGQDVLLQKVRRFPVDYWGAFVVYLVIAPIVVIYSAELYTDFRAQPVDWFRISLVSLIVSIIVGLPIFFVILDLFGKALSGIPITKPHVTIKVKVFLIGALVPLLIDTMLVQYYWTRTGYFTAETFGIWLALELLAVTGSLVFVRSFAQSLKPLQVAITPGQLSAESSYEQLTPQSTDEIGVIVSKYRRLLMDLDLHTDALELSNQILRDIGQSQSLQEVLTAIIKVCEKAIAGDLVFMMLKDEEGDELVCVAQSGKDYNPKGHFRLSLSETSMAVYAFHHGTTVEITDVESDARINHRIREQFSAKSALATPLQVEDKTLGVLVSISTKAKHQYSEREKVLFETVAHEAAIALNVQSLRDQRHQAEQRIKDSEYELRLILDNMQDTYYRTNIEGEVIRVSPSVQNLCGYQVDEILGTQLADLYLDSQGREKFSSYLKENNGRVHGYEAILKHKDGAHVWVSTNAQYYYDKAGNLSGVEGTTRDITRLKHAEEELLKHREHLEELVAERTMELEISNRELGSFSYSVSHDLRAPLRSIDGFSMALLEDYKSSLDETAMDYLGRIRGASQRMGELIDDLLMLARVTRSGITLKNIDLSAQVKEIVAALSEGKPQRRVNFNIQENINVKADRKLLYIALENLLGNAWKYTVSEETATICVGVKDSHEGPVYFVTDNGVGFDMLYVDKLFQPFQRLHRSDEFEGTGIGLATVQRIISRHGGKVWAEAEVGKGAKFYFTLDPVSQISTP